MFDQQRIADLEAEIERLSGAAERCRKVIMAAKLAVAVGCLLLAVTALGLLRLDPLVLVAAITATLGGIALAGSNRSTLDKILASISSCEDQRTELINRLGLRVVGAGDRAAIISQEAEQN